MSWLISASIDELNAQGEKFKWTQDLILNIHLRLMNTLISNAGIYRHHAVRVVGSYAPRTNYQTIPKHMSELIKLINQPVKNPLERLVKTHAIFEQIHPFSDGNGRTGRLIMFAQALQSKIVPLLIVKERKRAYYTYLETAHAQNEYSLLRLFIAESILFTDKLIKNSSI